MRKQTHFSPRKDAVPQRQTSIYMYKRTRQKSKDGRMKQEKKAKSSLCSWHRAMRWDLYHKAPLPFSLESSLDPGLLPPSEMAVVRKQAGMGMS